MSQGVIRPDGDEEFVRESNTLYETRDTARLEAFSDGVFAVAITLLVLDIKIPKTNHASIVRALLYQWPEYAAYFFSFIMIGIYWMNHHHIFKYIKRVDQNLLLLNVLLLAWVALLPFGTGLLASYVGEDKQLSRDSAFVFNIVALACAISFNILWRYASTHKELLEDDVDDDVIASLTKDFRFGLYFFVVATLLVYVSVPLSLGITLAISVFFALPALKRRKRAPFRG
jgi:uncharacterized membrane protein